MNTKTPECWASDPQARALRIEIAPGHSLLLPHDEFAFSELQHEGEGHLLRLIFAAHEILIRGHSLRRLETAMQRMELSFLAVLPDHQRLLIPAGQPLIHEINVVRIDSKEQT